MLIQAQSREQSKKCIQLQINLSIGKNKYLLEVERGAHLTQVIQSFLFRYNLNRNYQSLILTMVKAELGKRKKVKPQTEDLCKAKTDMDEKKKSIYEQQTQPISKKSESRENQFNGYKKQNKSTLNNLIHEFSQSVAQNSHKYQEPDMMKQKSDTDLNECKNLYEKWKKKQKCKEEVKKSPNAHKTPRKSISITKNKQVKKPQVHQNDYFYTNGIKFQQQKQVHVNELFQQNYPFRISNEHSLTPRGKKQLHERLFRQNKQKEASNLKREVDLKIKQRNSKNGCKDQIKQKVRERDQKIDGALQQLIADGMVKNPYRIQKISKSPFRNTSIS